MKYLFLLWDLLRTLATRIAEALAFTDQAKARAAKALAEEPIPEVLTDDEKSREAALAARASELSAELDEWTRKAALRDNRGMSGTRGDPSGSQ